MTDDEAFMAGGASANSAEIPPPPPPQNAMTVFSNGGMNEFPVLKAFQQYIDAEQNRARKRMLGLSVFFIVLLTVVVVTFVLVLMPVLARNQSLQDRLLDMVLTGQNAQQQAPAPAPVVNVQNSPAPAPAAALPPDYEARLSKIQQDNLSALADLRRQYEERDRAERERKDKAEREELERRLKEYEERLAASEREAQKRAAQVDAVARREAEREAFMRRQYPEQYRRIDARNAAAAPAPAAPAVSSLPPINGETDEEFIRRITADPEPEPVSPDAIMAPRTRTQTPKPAPAPAPVVEEDDDGDDGYVPVDYYSQYAQEEPAAQPAPAPAAKAPVPPRAAPPKLDFVFTDDDLD